MKAMRLFTSQGGLTLIEVLVTLLVISIGLAGMAALQLNSLQNAHSSYFRSVATTVARDLEERAWIEAATTNGCPPLSPADLMEHWRLANTERFALEGFVGLPRLVVTITPNSTFNSSSDRAWEGAVNIQWDEGRFDDSVSSKESFDFVLGLFCSEEVGS